MRNPRCLNKTLFGVGKKYFHFFYEFTAKKDKYYAKKA